MISGREVWPGLRISGFCDPSFRDVSETFATNFRERGEVGASVCVIAGGRTVVDLWGGIRDPRTGAPALTDLVSVTVIGPALPAAEIHAKVTLILGQKQGLAYLAAQPALSALLVTNEGRPILYGSFENKAYVYSINFTNTFVNLV